MWIPCTFHRSQSGSIPWLMPMSALMSSPARHHPWLAARFLPDRSVNETLPMIIESYNRFLHLLEESTTGKMVKANQFESNRMFVDYYLLDPGQEQKPHTHADNDKLYFVLEGRGTFLLGEHEHTIGAGEGCVAAAGEPSASCELRLVIAACGPEVTLPFTHSPASAIARTCATPAASSTCGIAINMARH